MQSVQAIRHYHGNTVTTDWGGQSTGGVLCSTAVLQTVLEYNRLVEPVTATKLSCSCGQKTFSNYILLFEKS